MIARDHHTKLNFPLPHRCRTQLTVTAEGENHGSRKLSTDTSWQLPRRRAVHQILVTDNISGNQSTPIDSTTSSIRLPPGNFTHFLTLSSKSFSTFPHGTCSLSVSQAYLALDGAYHPFRVALTSNSTPRRHQLLADRFTRACHPLREMAAFQRT